MTSGILEGERAASIRAGGLRKAWREGDRSAVARLLIVVLALVTLATFLASIMTGAADASIGNLLRFLTGMETAEQALSLRDRIILLEIRLPRAIMGLLVGAALAVAGAVMQGLFRNPLADPGLVGISAGASLGAVLTIVLGGTLFGPLFSTIGPYALPLAAFAGALGATLLLYRLATHNQQTSIATMLLAGIALAALANAITGVLIFVADDKQLRDLTFWGLGSLAGANWTKIAAAGPVILAGILAAPLLARGLNALTLGEAAAFHMGIPVQRLKTIAILSVAGAVGASVAVSGGIGFVGIVVPHILRMVIGPDNRTLLPASALLGGTLLLFADMIARTIVPPAELPIGIITAFAGAPFFLWILMRGRARLGL